MRIEVSIGEFFDKITILSIKKDRIFDHSQLVNVYKELFILWQTYSELLQDMPSRKRVKCRELYEELFNTNLQLWDIEDAIRRKENLREWDGEFIELARSVYMTNDKRSEIKKRINQFLESEIIEEKQYAKYVQPS